MHFKRALILLFALVSPSTVMCAQDVQVSRANKTIAVTADESVSVAPDLALVSLGVHAYAETQEAAYAEVVRVADRILKAEMAAGLPEGGIETKELEVSRVDPESTWSPEMKKQRQFEAVQTWKFSVRASDAQSVVDIGMKSGANKLIGVEWAVADPVALQGKAGGAALAKARMIAEQMAKGLGAKLGDLVYASNRAPAPKLWRGFQLNTSSAVEVRAKEMPQLKLYPEKVKEEATVHAVFAIE